MNAVKKTADGRLPSLVSARLRRPPQRRPSHAGVLYYEGQACRCPKSGDEVYDV